MSNKKTSISMLVSSMPMARFELARAYTHCDLNTARLPIPPHRQSAVEGT